MKWSDRSGILLHNNTILMRRAIMDVLRRWGKSILAKSTDKLSMMALLSFAKKYAERAHDHLTLSLLLCNEITVRRKL